MFCCFRKKCSIEFSKELSHQEQRKGQQAEINENQIPKVNSVAPDKSEQEGVSALFSSQYMCGSPPSCGYPNAIFERRMRDDDQSYGTSPEDLLEGLSDLKRLGRGGFGHVFQARWRHVDVAVKIIVSSKDDNGSARGEEMARCEALLSEGLRHPNVIQTFQTRRGPTTQAWINQVMSCTTPILEKHEYSSSAPKEVPTQEGPQDLKNDHDGLDYDSDDGYGAPDKGLQSDVKPMSIKEVMELVKPKVNGSLTVIIMELADKGTLEWAKNVKLFNLAAVPPTSRRWRQLYRAILRTMRELAQGISALHSMSIVHCDLKPSNVLLKLSRHDVRGFSACLCDFGLSKFEPLHENKKLEKACGTLLYMAPERLDGVVCKASDIYSFGIMLFEISTGIEPFSDMLTKEITIGVSEGRLRPSWPESYMPELRPLFLRCTEQAPSNRPSASEVVQELINIESELRRRVIGSL